MKKLFWSITMIFVMFFLLSVQVVNADTLCGDSNIEGAETCDDGNTDDWDGCSSICEVESGYECLGEPSVCLVICGDGMIAGNDEMCDDGNDESGDGCSDVCLVEDGWECSYMPSVCILLGGDDLPYMNSTHYGSLIDSLSIALSSIFLFIVDSAALWLTLAAALMILYFLRSFLSVKGAYSTAQSLKTQERPKYLKSRL